MDDEKAGRIKCTKQQKKGSMSLMLPAFFIFSKDGVQNEIKKRKKEYK